LQQLLLCWCCCWPVVQRACAVAVRAALAHTRSVGVRTCHTRRRVNLGRPDAARDDGVCVVTSAS
jgi:hypothetical protein